MFQLKLDAYLNHDYSRRAQRFLDDYQNHAVGYESFDLEKLGPCSQFPYIEYETYGNRYSYVRPCIFLKLNKIWGWEPYHIDNSDFEWRNWSQSLEDHFYSLKYNQWKNVFVDCQADMEFRI